jgi:hypothetical protein
MWMKVEIRGKSHDVGRLCKDRGRAQGKGEGGIWYLDLNAITYITYTQRRRLSLGELGPVRLVSQIIYIPMAGGRVCAKVARGGLS